ncbi:MAG: DUF1150 domain-containing protein [Alphaproteobacteria bacterium]|nr:DUF1150 domain-containing protein [Alphaproteobacteria bacterium]MDH5558642.1 DUF1150 domain-containing protein [Alphaproteobacteria bacterium]
MLNITALKTITQQDLAMLGYGEIAYIRPLIIQGEQVFAVMGADGRQIGLAGDRDSANRTAYGEDLVVFALN